MKNKMLHRSKVGGLWDEMGQLQFNFLKSNGLLPEHNFLDIACGSFRAGRFIIDYLNKNNYYGIDLDIETVEAGKQYEINHLIKQKSPNILINNEFEFELFNQKFDFMIAQSLWTHLDLNIILKCIINIKKVLKSDGKCFVTFFENSDINNLNKIRQPNKTNELYTFLDKDPFHYTFSTLKNIINEVGLNVKYMGDWNHPRNQKMLLITHT